MLDSPLPAATMPLPANDVRALRIEGLEQSRGWSAHASGLPYDATRSPRWRHGWTLRAQISPRKDDPVALPKTAPLPARALNPDELATLRERMTAAIKPGSSSYQAVEAVLAAIAASGFEIMRPEVHPIHHDGHGQF